LEIIYILSLVNKQIRKQIMKYHARIIHKDFEEIMLALLIQKFGICGFLPRFPSTIQYDIEGSKTLFTFNAWMPIRFYVIPSLEIDLANNPQSKQQILKLRFSSICKFNKRKLLKYILSTNTYQEHFQCIYFLAKKYKMFDVVKYIEDNKLLH